MRLAVQGEGQAVRQAQDHGHRARRGRQRRPDPGDVHVEDQEERSGTTSTTSADRAAGYLRRHGVLLREDPRRGRGPRAAAGHLGRPGRPRPDGAVHAVPQADHRRRRPLALGDVRAQRAGREGRAGVHRADGVHRAGPDRVPPRPAGRQRRRRPGSRAGTPSRPPTATDAHCWSPSSRSPSTCRCPGPRAGPCARRCARSSTRWATGSPRTCSTTSAPRSASPPRAWPRPQRR